MTKAVKILTAVVVILLLNTMGCSTAKKQGEPGTQGAIQGQTVVYLKGYVQKPGTYFVSPRTELGEVIKLAGGFAADADTAKVDLKKPVTGVLEITIPGLQDVSPAPIEAQLPADHVLPSQGAAPSSPNVQAAPPVKVYRSGLSLSEQEQQLVALVNRERSSRGITPLTVDGRLTKVARLKSQDMLDNNYFAHESPKYGSPSAMISAQGITYHYVGENIAIDSSVESAHHNLMGSPGHRQGILNPNFNRLGIGIVQGAYGLVITQHFAD